MDQKNKERNFQRSYRRSLTHILPEGATIFFTYGLYKALPKHVIKKLKEDREIEKLRILHESKDKTLINEKLKNLKSAYFGKYDDLLDNEKSGDRYLEIEPIAKIVQESITYLSRCKYHLVCYCIMPNHVHKIVSEKGTFIGHLMQSHKGYTGKAVNKLLNRSGPFWQKESFDMVIRNENHLIQKVRYVMNNPISAGLAKNFREWKYSYINPDYEYIMQ